MSPREVVEGKERRRSIPRRSEGLHSHSRVTRSRAAIHDPDPSEREVEALGKAVDPICDINVVVLVLELLDRPVLVEERGDEVGVDGDHDDLEGEDEDHGVGDKGGTGQSDDLEEGGKDGQADEGSQSLTFDEIETPGPEGGLVEAVLHVAEGLGVGEARRRRWPDQYCIPRPSSTAATGQNSQSGLDASPKLTFSSRTKVR